MNDLVKDLNTTKKMEAITSVNNSGGPTGDKDNSSHEVETVEDALKVFANESNDLIEEAKKMIERNRKHTKITKEAKKIINKSEKKNENIKPMRRTITKFKNVSKNTALKKELDMGKKLAEEMLNEISEKRKERRKRLEMKKEKKIEGELRVGKLTVIKDISKIRKCDKRMKDKIYKLSNEAIDRIMKRK